MVYNMDFLISSLIFLLLILLHFLGERKLDDYNSRSFLIFALIGLADVFFDILCTILISADEYEEAMNEEILLTTMPEFQKKHKTYKKLTESDEEFENPDIIPWPVETALYEFADYLVEQYELEDRAEGIKMFNAGGYKLYLTTDRDVQAHLDDTYKDWYYFPEDLDTEGEMVQSAIAVMDYKGHILGLEGKLGVKDSNLGFNAAYQGGRQPGSTIKPVTTYGYGIESGLITYNTYFTDHSPPITTDCSVISLRVPFT